MGRRTPASAWDMERLSGEALSAEPDDFFDILEERRRSNDLSHALRSFNPQRYRGATPISAAALNRMVLESQYLSYIIQEIVVESDEPREAVQEEASAILDEMSQNLQLGFIRLLGFAMTKVFKSVFSSIYVNEEGLTRLQQAIQEHPVILMPNHRSYMDFLVLSYIMFTYDLSIPVIAAGIPLMGMKLIGEIFRRSGAFFIRRAIGSDKLYWAVLSEYVKTIVRTGYAPLEFYVEGLRSRTLKSLTPKLGMMHMVLEPFFKGEVVDLSLVPISISYERVLEESLLAHELLGVPKPRETTGGLLKARTVLKEDYGCMHVCFGNPVSVRDLVKGKINRRQYNLVPRDLPMKPNKETQEFVSGLAHMIIRLQERNAVLSAWNLMVMVLLQNLQGIDLDLLTNKTLWVRRIALQFGAHIRWPKHVLDSEVMSSSLTLHHSVVRCERGRVYLVEEAVQEEGVFRRAAAVLMCASYRNQAVHVFTRPAMVAVAITTAVSSRTDDVFHHFKFLLELFSNEFVFIPDQAVQDYEEGCSLLQQSGVIGRSDEEVYVRDNGQESIVFLRAILQPFIESYQVVFRYLCEESSQTFREKMFSTSIRSFVMKLLISGEVQSYEGLSSDLQRNVLSALLRMAAVTKTKVDDQNEFRVNKSAVKRIWDMLNDGWTPRISDARL
ncbi:dihydroxyacetone phosphate acyltransferase [Pimephales promelas]|uniref:dihydroxyacetone phosphate acyltransferase n=1 Tax=Pimephales promelas TaxID=90988 RepID=UPI001955DFAB|nr:dihydroxyacetone phosphate acyltransferase [Pimephales promelas]KAG1938404.1 glycerol-3-phosphate acyltransferase 1, mitochondrial [Pimephales promelas]